MQAFAITRAQFKSLVTEDLKAESERKMHSSVGLGKSSERPAGETLAADLLLVKAGEAECRCLLPAWHRCLRSGSGSVDHHDCGDIWLPGIPASCAGQTHYCPAHSVLGVAFAFAVVMVLMLDRIGAYRRGNSLLRVREQNSFCECPHKHFCFLSQSHFSAASSFHVGFWFCA